MQPQTKKQFPITRDALKVTRMGANGPMVDDIIRRLDASPRVLLFGAHGSGKTTVAFDAAIKLKELRGTGFHFVHCDDWIEHPELTDKKGDFGLLIVDEIDWLCGQITPEPAKEFERRLLDLETLGIKVIVTGHNAYTLTELPVQFFGREPRRGLFDVSQALHVPATSGYEEVRQLLTKLKEMGIEFSQEALDENFGVGKNLRYIVLATRVLTSLGEENVGKPISLERLDDLIRQEKGHLFAVFDDFVNSLPRDIALCLLHEPLGTQPHRLHEAVLWNLINYSGGNANPLFLEFARLKLAELDGSGIVTQG